MKGEYECPWLLCEPRGGVQERNEDPSAEPTLREMPFVNVVGSTTNAELTTKARAVPKRFDIDFIILKQILKGNSQFRAVQLYG